MNAVNFFWVSNLSRNDQVLGGVACPRNPVHYVILNGNNLLRSTDDEIVNILAHELGHIFGLAHPWITTGNCFDDCCSSGDGVCDTNPWVAEEGVDSSTSLPCFEDSATTNCSNLSAQQNNVMNYTYGDCQREFTDEQYDRMVITIPQKLEYILDEGSQNVAGLNNPSTISYDLYLGDITISTNTEFIDNSIF